LYVLGRPADDGGKLDLPVHRLGVAGNLDGRAGVGDGARGFDEMPRLEALLVRIGRRRMALFRRHRRGVVGVIGAGAIDGRRIPHRREQLGLAERLALRPAFGRGSGGFFQRALGRLPVFQDTDDRGIGRLAGQLCRIEHIVADDKTGARPIARPIGREFVSGVFCRCHFAFTSLLKTCLCSLAYEALPQAGRDQTAIRRGWQAWSGFRSD
jgi:hypothetical protein